ncbi:MAG TPA: hypothetical protein VMZ73_08440 [Acidimicrobiales bacterium]|nr:hypothetical protein [Acidimicrobiales bacterium]
MLSADKRAERTLTNIFWGGGGWKPERWTPPPDERAHAVAAGYLFDPVAMDHDELVMAVRNLAGQVTLRGASEWFLASLTTRWRFLRPALPAVVVGQSLPAHEFSSGAGRRTCGVCGLLSARQEINLDVLSFERHRWGGVRHTDLSFVWFCLDRLLVEGPADPSTADISLMSLVLDALRSLPEATTLTQAEGTLGMLKSSKDERMVLLESLSVVGILESREHPGFLGGFVPVTSRELPGLRFTDRGYPGAWWTAADGVNDAALRTVFPQLNPE